MGNVLVTGGTGFLGRHLLDALTASGVSPGDGAVFCRKGDPELTAAGHEVIEGSVTSQPHLVEACQGRDVVYHLAGRVDRSPDALGNLMHVHVEGTRNAILAAAEAGVPRVVYASTSGTIGVSRRSKDVLNEDAPYPLDIVRNWPYYLSKVYAEQAALQASKDTGVEVVMVNPTLLLGPGDDRQSSTGDVLKFMRRRIPSVPSGGMSFVDVRDVATATLAAAQRGRPGKRYLMTAANWTVDKFLRHLEGVTGVKAPVIKVPDGAARMAARVMQWGYDAMGSTPPVDRISVEMSQHFWYVDASRAKAELGFAPRDVNDTLRDTVDALRTRYGL